MKMFLINQKNVIINAFMNFFRLIKNKMALGEIMQDFKYDAEDTE